MIEFSYQTGLFFTLDKTEAGNFSTEVFRYRRVCNSQNDKIEYPIYVALKNNTIEFQFQGRLPFQETDSPGTGIPIPIYGQSQILTISLYTGDIVATTSVINQVFNKPFPLLPEYTLRKVEGNCYAQVFLKQDMKAEDLFFRVLFTDFLEDFFNATVFHQSSRYDTIRISLLEIPIIRAIYRKADMNVKTNFLGNADENEERVIKTSSAQIALDKWVDFMSDVSNNQLFALNKSEIRWLGYKDEEMSNAFKILKQLVQNDQNEQTREILSTIANTQLRDYSVTGALKTVIYTIAEPGLKGKFGDFTRSFCMFFVPAAISWILYLLIAGEYYPEKKPATHALIILILLLTMTGILLALFTFVSRYSASVNLLLPRLQMGVSTSWIGLGISNEVWKNNFDLLPGEGLVVATVLLLLTGLLVSIDIRKNTKLKNRWRIMFKTIPVVLSGLVFSMFISIIITTLWAPKLMQRSDFFESRFMQSSIYEIDSMYSKKEEFKRFLDSIDIEIAKIHVTDSGVHLPKNLVKDSLLKYNRQIISKAIGEIDLLTEPKRIIDSLRYGAYYLKDRKDSPYGRKARATVTIKFPRNNYIMIFPGFLFAISAFAVFSGIFLTLLFDDKPITNPL